MNDDGLDFRRHLDVTEVDLAALVQTAYRLSSPGGLGHAHYQDDQLTDAEAECLVDRRPDAVDVVRIDYLRGRAVKLHVVRDRSSGKLYLYHVWQAHGPEETRALHRWLSISESALVKAQAEEDEIAEEDAAYRRSRLN